MSDDYEIGDTVLMKEEGDIQPKGLVTEVDEDSHFPYEIQIFDSEMELGAISTDGRDIEGLIGKNIPRCTKHDSTMLYNNNLNIWFCTFCKQKFSIRDRLWLYKVRVKNRIRSLRQ